MCVAVLPAFGVLSSSKKIVVYPFQTNILYRSSSFLSSLIKTNNNSRREICIHNSKSECMNVEMASGI